MQHIKFSPAPEYLAKLQVAINEAHGCDAEHESTWMGVEHVGPLLWSGSVEVFLLNGDAPSDRAFAWSKVEGGQLHCLVVLKNEEIGTAEAAVRHVLAEKLLQHESPASA